MKYILIPFLFLVINFGCSQNSIKDMASLTLREFVGLDRLDTQQRDSFLITKGFLKFRDDSAKSVKDYGKDKPLDKECYSEGVYFSSEYIAYGFLGKANFIKYESLKKQVTKEKFTFHRNINFKSGEEIECYLSEDKNFELGFFIADSKSAQNSCDDIGYRIVLLKY